MGGAEDAYKSVGRTVAIIGSIAATVWGVWFTWVAFVGGRLPLPGDVTTEGSVGFGIVMLLVGIPVIDAIAYWLFMAVMLLLAAPFYAASRRRPARAGATNARAADTARLDTAKANVSVPTDPDLAWIRTVEVAGGHVQFRRERPGSIGIASWGFPSGGPTPSDMDQAEEALRSWQRTHGEASWLDEDEEAAEPAADNVASPQLAAAKLKSEPEAARSPRDSHPPAVYHVAAAPVGPGELTYAENIFKDPSVPEGYVRALWAPPRPQAAWNIFDVFGLTFEFQPSEQSVYVWGAFTKDGLQPVLPIAWLTAMSRFRERRIARGLGPEFPWDSDPEPEDDDSDDAEELGDVGYDIYSEERDGAELIYVESVPEEERPPELREPPAPDWDVVTAGDWLFEFGRGYHGPYAKVWHVAGSGSWVDDLDESTWRFAKEAINSRLAARGEAPWFS